MSKSLSMQRFYGIKVERKVFVVWDAVGCHGNGPHEYTVRNDLSAIQLFDNDNCISCRQLLNGINDVALINPSTPND